MTAANQIQIEDLARLQGFYAVQPSWNGQQVAYYSDVTGTMELFWMDLRTGEKKQLTHGEGPKAPRAGLLWTRDDKAVVFTKDNDGDERHNLFLLTIADGEIRQIVDRPESQEYAVDVSPDNQYLALTSTKTGQMNLHVADLKTLEWKQMTDFSHPVSGVGYSPDGKWIAFNANETENLRNSDGYLVSVETGEVKKVFSVSNHSQDSLVEWHPDGQHLAVTSDVEGNSRPGLFDLHSGETRWYGTAGVEESAQGLSPDGAYLAVVRNQDSCLQPVLYRTGSGEEQPLDFPPGVAMGAHFVDDGTKLLAQFGTPTSRMQLVKYDLASGTMETIIAAEYGNLAPAMFVDCAYVQYPSFDGKLVPAILYKPQQIAPGEKVAAIVAAHGGPTGQWFRNFDPYAQLLVDRGFVVIEPNVRGSTGYGVEWRDTNIGDWGGGDLEDVAAGVEFLKGLGYVDSERIGIWGGSYGGYMSFIAVARKPALFKAAAPIVGISDLPLLYEEDMPHFQYYLKQQMGDPVENAALWRERSAITYVADVTAKLLIVHGVNDPRCPIGQARNFRAALERLGKTEGTAADNDFEYHEFEDEGHGGGADYVQRLRHFKLLEDFFTRRL